MSRSALPRTRRRLIGVLISAVLLAACGGGDSSEEDGATTGDSGDEATAKLAIGVESLSGNNWDPLSGSISSGTIFDLIYDPLVGYDAIANEFDADLGLAESWEVSADGMSWTFTIREGVKFHDGSTLTSDDVKFSIERYKGPDSLTPFVKLLTDTIESVEATDPQTVVVATKVKAPFLPLYFSVGNNGIESYIVPKAYVDEGGPDALAKKPVGTGPYRLVEDVPGESITLEPFDDYWGAEATWQELTFIELPEQGARIAELQTGGIDFTPLDFDGVQEIAADESLRVLERANSAQIVIMPSWGGSPPDSPLRDKSVRQALSMAIDREEIVEELYGGHAEVNGIPYGLRATAAQVGLSPEDEVFQVEYDPDAARALLEEAGHADLTIDMVTYAHPTFASGLNTMLAVKGYWEAIGIKVNVTQDDWTTFLDKIVTGHPDARNKVFHIMNAARPYIQLPSSFSRLFTPSDDGINYVELPAAAEATKLAQEAEDPEEMAEHIADAMVIAAEEAALFPLAGVSTLFAANENVPDFRFASLGQGWGRDLFMADN